MCETDVQNAFDAFYDKALTALDNFFSVHTYDAMHSIASSFRNAAHKSSFEA